MKTIGLIGGMSWESSVVYYRLLNEAVRERRGGLHSACCVLYSVDFAEIEALQHEGRWEDATALMVDAARRLERAGAELLLIATNTMHRMAEAVEKACPVPLLHIADATAEQIKTDGLGHVGLLGTRYTMEQDFYRGRLEQRHGLSVLVPAAAGRELVHRAIYDELCLGVLNESTRQGFREVMARLVEEGAQAIILGCTEIGLLVKPGDAPVPLYDTTAIHARRAVEQALQEP
jgi:aspartate racemase